MKKNVLFGLMALSLATVATAMLASCSKEECDVDSLVQYGKPRDVAISATWESGNAAKAYMDDASRNVYWQTGDIVNFNGTELVASSVSGTTATFNGTISPIMSGGENVYYGVYPTALNPNFSESGVTVTLPAVQTYNSTPLNQANIMVGRCITSSDNISVGFKNVCAVLKIGLKCKSGETGDNAKIGKIVLSSTNAKLSGNATVTFNDDNNISSVSMASDALNQVTLNCSGTSLNSSSYTYFYVMVPNTAVGKNLTMKICDAKGYEMTKSISSLTNTLLSNHVYTTELTTDFNRDYIPHPFSVSATKQVYFSNGNLWYKVSDNTWHFENEQYGYHTTPNIGSTYAPSGFVVTSDGYGLLDWSVGATNNYGVTHRMAEGPFVDWGHHPIIGGDGTTVYPAGTWYTLTVEEWAWLVVGGGRDVPGYTFPTPTNRWPRQRAFCEVDFGSSVKRKGLVLMPDDYTGDIRSYENNGSMSNSKWIELQQAGAVFLPAVGMGGSADGGYSYESYSFNNYCFYWSATPQDAEVAAQRGAWDMCITKGEWEGCPNGSSPGQLHTVRLVRNAN